MVLKTPRPLCVSYVFCPVWLQDSLGSLCLPPARRWHGNLPILSTLRAAGLAVAAHSSPHSIFTPAWMVKTTVSTLLLVKLRLREAKWAPKVIQPGRGTLEVKLRLG